MSLTPGTRVGRYEIVALIGAGGMGEVYRANDTELGRPVAAKVLPDVFAADPDRRSRFEREARALASLNHPNVAQIYGVERFGDRPAIVMELVEGEDLAARLARGAIPWTDALPIARQIADALDSAHERGIMHRDLKPANIKVAPDETVKVLDFGLAKAMDPAIMGQALSPHSNPTITSPATQLGVIVGTAAYMAPEQAKGKLVDKRVDVWAFGCVLYEMLTAVSPFKSDSVAESIGLVVTRDPDWSALPPEVPSAAVNLIRRCLAKDPKQRLRDIGEASILLANVPIDGETSPGPARHGRRHQALLAVLVLALAAAAAAAAWYFKPAVDVPLRRFQLPQAIASARSYALSPDGRRVAYLAEGRLFVLDFQETTPRDLGTISAGVAAVFWSPDSRQLGYVGEGMIRTLPSAGGASFLVTRVPGGRVTGVTWTRDNSIVFAGWRDSLYTVPATGGTPEVRLALNPESEIDFHEVQALADGRLVLTVHAREGSNRFEMIDGNERRLLTDAPGVGLVWRGADGRVLFLREGDNQGVWTVRDTGGSLNLAEASVVEPGATSFGAADDGTLLVGSTAPVTSSLLWVNAHGTTTDVPGKPIDDAGLLALSPRSDRAIYIAGVSKVFVRDLSTGADIPVGSTASQPAAAGSIETMNPAWFPSGDRIMYAAGAVEAMKIVSWPADGGGAASVLATGIGARLTPDGRTLLWLKDDRGRGRLLHAPIAGDRPPDQRGVAVPGTEEHNVRHFDLSHDGRLIAFAERATSGQQNVHILEYPGGQRRQVTLDGGTSPGFSPDGRELYFLSGARVDGVTRGRLMMARLVRDPALKVGIPEVRLKEEDPATPSLQPFAVGRDGRLLMTRAVDSAAERARLVLIQNWRAAMQK